eukprot:351762-Chlamydomonas_euryale.AAC.12
MEIEARCGVWACVSRQAEARVLLLRAVPVVHIGHSGARLCLAKRWRSRPGVECGQAHWQDIQAPAMSSKVMAIEARCGVWAGTSAGHSGARPCLAGKRGGAWSGRAALSLVKLGDAGRCNLQLGSRMCARGDMSTQMHEHEQALTPASFHTYPSRALTPPSTLVPLILPFPVVPLNPPPFLSCR